MVNRFLHSLAGLAVIATLSTVAAAEPVIVPANSRPSEELKLSFQTPGVVKEVPVHEGDRVERRRCR